MSRRLQRSMSKSRAALNRPWLKPAVLTFDPDTHTYRIDGVVVFSVTQVLTDNGFIDFSHIPNGTLEAARYRGTWVHAAIVLLLKDQFDWAACPDEYRGYLESAVGYIETLKKRPLPNGVGVEARFWELQRMYAGTIDWLGLDADDVLSIDDWKTGEPEDVAAALQLGAYEHGVRSCLLHELLPGYVGPIRRRAIKLFKDGKPARVERYDDPRDAAMFFMALSCSYFRRNHCRHGGPR